MVNKNVIFKRQRKEFLLLNISISAVAQSYKKTICEFLYWQWLAYLVSGKSPGNEQKVPQGKNDEDSLNWFAYVGNEPINRIDRWGLSASDSVATDPTYFTQDQWANSFGQAFSDEACAATACINEVSERYTTQTENALILDQGINMMQNAVDNNTISGTDAHINDWPGAANDMWDDTGLEGSFSYNEDGEHQIYAEDANQDGRAEHFTNSSGEDEYFDTYSGETGTVGDPPLHLNRPTRGFDFNQ